MSQKSDKNFARRVQAEFGCGYAQALHLIRKARADGVLKPPAPGEVHTKDTAMQVLKAHYAYDNEETSR